MSSEVALHTQNSHHMVSDLDESHAAVHKREVGDLGREVPLAAYQPFRDTFVGEFRNGQFRLLSLLFLSVLCLSFNLALCLFSTDSDPFGAS